MFQVVVGNIGTVINTSDKAKAQHAFNEYVSQSKSGVGRAGGETITLFQDDEILMEHVGSLDNE